MSKIFHPHDYQTEAIRFLRDTPRGGLWMPMGGGKSVSTLTALCDLAHVEDVFPALVLAPLRVANSTWIDEIAKWTHTQRLTVSPIAWRSNPQVSATARERLARLRRPADIYTLPYDNLVWLLEALDGEWPFRTVVADEVTRLKSFRLRQGSKRAKALGKVAHTKVDRFIGLTGTPGGNGLKDLWGPTWFYDKGERLGRTFSAFEQRWFRKGWDGYSLEPMAHAQDEIQNLLKDICLTVKGLPVDEPISNTLYVDLPPKAREHYRTMETKMFAEIGEHGIEAANAAVRTSKCLQIAGGTVFTDEDGDYEEIHDAKLDALESVIEEAAGMPVLVSYNYVPELKRILKRFPGARHLDADPATVERWNAGRIPVLVAHPASAGHGLNLQDGGNIIAFYGSNWNLEYDQQIIERIGPMRQKQSGYDRPVFVHRIVARDTVDEMVLERLATKKSVQAILLAAMERRKEESSMIYRTHPNSRSGPCLFKGLRLFAGKTDSTIANRCEGCWKTGGCGER